MKTYFVSMHYSDRHQDKYITCIDDYDDVERAGLDPDENYQFDTLEEAEKVKAEVEAYAREKGDDYTTFGIETFDLGRDMAEEALGRMNCYRTVEYIIAKNETQRMVVDITEDIIDALTSEGELDVVPIKDMDSGIIEAMKESLDDDECFSEDLDAIIVKHTTDDFTTYILCYDAR